MVEPEPASDEPPGRTNVSRIHHHPADPVRAFRIDVDGYVTGDDPAAREAAGTVAYVVRVAEAVGTALGAGTLRALEVSGPATLHAAVQRRLSGQLDVIGLLDPLGSAPESLHERLQRSRS